MVTDIIKKLHMANVTLYWIHGHAGIKEKKEADKLTKAATREESDELPQRDGMSWYLLRLALTRAKIAVGSVLSRRVETGKFTGKIDAALHLGRSAELYSQPNSVEAAILTQLRTGKMFLKEYLYRIKACETAACNCGHTTAFPLLM